MRCVAAAAAMMLAAATNAQAHDGVHHANQAEAAAHAGTAPPPGAPPPLPFDLGGPFRLIDQTGRGRGEADPQGRLQLVFFGYANCESICSVAMPMMAAAVDALAARGVETVPVMITVDPRRDTVDTMAAPLRALHPTFVGLTGTDSALSAVRTLFRVESGIAFTDPETGPVFAHGSHVYLLDGSGTVLTLLPPILSPEHAADIVASYAEASGRGRGDQRAP